MKLLVTLFKSGLPTFVVRIIGAGLSFFSMLVYARVLGVGGFGIFSLALTVITIASVISRWGLDNVLLKQVAAHTQDRPKIANGYVLTAVLMTVSIGLPISFMFWFFSDDIAKYIFSEPEMSIALSTMAWLIIPMAGVLLMGEALKAYAKPVFATLLQNVLPPSVSLIALFSFWLLDFISLEIVVFAVVFGFVVSFMISVVGWMKVAPCYEFSRQSLKGIASQGWPMLLISSGALIMAWSDTVILGIYKDASEVGVYSAASRVVMITSLILIAINSITAPKYARYYNKGDSLAIAKLAQTASALLLLIVSIPSAILILFPEWVMSWFGFEYTAGAGILVILALGQMVNVVCGSVGYLLSMTGKEHTFRNIMLLTAVFNIILSVFLVQDYAAYGVAFSTAFSVIVWNLWSMYEVKKHLGFWTVNIVGFRK